MADPIKVAIKKSDIAVQEPSTTIVSSVELVNALVVDSADAWQSLAASFTAVDTNNVRVTADGKIVIKDEQFTTLVKQFLADPGGASTNAASLCGNYKCIAA